MKMFDQRQKLPVFMTHVLPLGALKTLLVCQEFKFAIHTEQVRVANVGFCTRSRIADFYFYFQNPSRMPTKKFKRLAATNKAE